jgi:hypothetical protein
MLLHSYIMTSFQNTYISKHSLHYTLRQAQGEDRFNPHAEPGEALSTIIAYILTSKAAWILAVLLQCAITQRATAQMPNSETHWSELVRIKIGGGVMANQHWANFPELSGYPVFTPRDSFNAGPANFRNTLSYAWYGGIGVDVPLSSAFALGIMANAASHNALLTTSEQTRVGTANGASADALIRYVYDTRVLTTGLEAMLAWRMFEGAGLSLCAGARGAWVLDRRVFQREELVTPTFGGFTPQGDRQRNVRQGAIENVEQIQAHALAGLRYDIAISLQGSWLLITPEVQIGYPLTRFTQTEAWQLAFARGGLAISIAAKPEEKPREPVLPPPPSGYTVPVQKKE